MKPSSDLRDRRVSSRRLLRAGTGAALLAPLFLLAACGGSSNNDPAPVQETPAPGPAPAPAASAFTKSATWEAVVPAAGTSICYDFDAAAEVANCAGTSWDVKLASATRGTTFATNSGPNGEGRGGAFGGPFDHTWAELLTWQNATTDPVSGAIPANLYFADAARSAFSGTNPIGSAIFEYSVNNDNRLYPTYRTFLVTSDASNADATGAAVPVYVVQVVGYYGGDGGTTSGYIHLQWIDRAAPGSVRTATVDARTGWAYFDLASGTTSSETGTWHLAFSRYNVKTNGGVSGTGTVGAFVGSTPAGLYDAAGSPIVAAFTAATPESMVGQLTAEQAGPTSAAGWVRDTVSSSLAPTSQGSFPGPLDYGWYRYYSQATDAAAAGLPSVAHIMGAVPERGTLIRSGEGNSYARMRLAQIRYAVPTDATSAQTWVVEFGVQPAQ